MWIDRRLLAGLVGLVLVVGACGSSAASPTAPSPTATPGASEPAASADAGQSEPAASDETATEAPSGPEVSFQPGAAGDLEAMLPSSVAGLTFTKQSFDGASIAAAVGVPIDTGDLDPILAANGKTLADVRMAIATAMSPTSPAIVVAFQIRGLDASKVLDLLAGGSASDLTPTTVAGKQVLSLGSDMGGGVLYVKGDVAFEVILANPATLEAIVAALP